MLAIAIVLIIAWFLCVVVFKLAVLAVHILLIMGIIALVMHFLRKARTTV